MKANFLLFNLTIIIFTSLTSYGQTRIDIRIKQVITPKAHLYFKNIEQDVLIDSSTKTNNDHFVFSLSPNNERGIYKIKVGKNISFEFIVGQEKEVALETVIYSVEDSLKSKNSIENDIYIKYLKLKKRESQLTWFLESAMDFYSDTSKFRKSLESELLKIRIDFNTNATNLISSNANLLVSKLISLELRPERFGNEIGLDDRAQKIKNWWINCDLSDSALLNLPQLSKKLWDYFDLVYNDNLDKEEQESAFLDAAKVVLRLNGDKKIVVFFRQILHQEFSETDYHDVANYLSMDQRIIPEGKDNKRDNSIVSAEYSLGQKIMDFKLSQAYGKKRISEIKSNYKLLVFWSSWCPHCIEMLPELKKVYHNYKDKGFEIIAVSVDDEIENCNAIIMDKRLDWINENINNLQKSVKSKLNIVETPKYYLVDKNLVIISLPSNIRQVEAKLKKLVN